MADIQQALMGFATPVAEPSGLEKFGRALQGFSAGVAGQLPQYMAQQNQLDESRRRAAALDLLNARNRLQRAVQDSMATGEPPDLSGVKALANERIGILEEDGRDASDTLRELQMVEEKPMETLEAWNDLLEGAAAEGLIRLPNNFRQKAAISSPKTEIFKNGTTIQTDNQGGVVVRNPAGDIVTGQARMDALQAARDADLAFARTLSGERTAGSEGVKLASKLFDQLEGVNKAVGVMTEGIEALDAGAKTGPIMSHLPSVRAASIQLDQVQKQLGLNVIQNTTFGALSEGELALALNTGLPSHLEPVELRSWLEQKRDAQEKLANYLEDATIFLGVPGNTLADWVALQRNSERERNSARSAPKQQIGRFIVERVR